MSVSPATALTGGRKEPEIFESPEITVDVAKEEEKKGADGKGGDSGARMTSEDVNRDPLRPQWSFEQFAGRIFDTSKLDFSDAIVRQLTSGQSELSSMRPSERSFESPLERFNRLKSEVAQFKQDLSELSGSKDSSAVASELIKQLSALEQEVQQTAAKPAFQPLLSSNVTDRASAAQAQLLQKLVADMEKAAKSTEAKGGAGGVTYELYYNPQKEAARQQVSVGELDKRIGSLEKAVGSLQDDKTFGFSDLNTALVAMRKKLDFLEQGRLDSIYRRIKTLLTELEQLQQQKDKAQQAGQVPPNFEKVNATFDMMARWDEAAQLLPSVIARLQSLRDLHEECSSAVLRLQNVDSVNTQLNTLLQQDKETLQKVEHNLAQNMKVMQGNVQSLESRFAALAAKIEKL